MKANAERGGAESRINARLGAAGWRSLNSITHERIIK
jgi:hypothetical protein